MSVENVEFAGEMSYMAERLVADHVPFCQPTHGNFCDCPRRMVREETWAWRYRATVNGKTAAVIVQAHGQWEKADEEERDIALEEAASALSHLAAGQQPNLLRSGDDEDDGPEDLPTPSFLYRHRQDMARPNPLYWPPKGTT